MLFVCVLTSRAVIATASTTYSCFGCFMGEREWWQEGFLFFGARRTK